MMQELTAQRPGPENDLSTLGSDPYKPFYRSIQIATCLFKDVGRAPTMEEIEAILRVSHPWFVHALDHPEDRQVFETVWDFHYECWWGPENGVYSDNFPKKDA